VIAITVQGIQCINRQFINLFAERDSCNTRGRTSESILCSEPSFLKLAVQHYCEGSTLSCVMSYVLSTALHWLLPVSVVTKECDIPTECIWEYDSDIL